MTHTKPDTELENYVSALGCEALKASRRLAVCTPEQKNAALLEMSYELARCQDEIVHVNQEEVEAARRRGLPAAMCDRLLLTEGRFRAMLNGLRDVAALPDPVGAELNTTVRPNGLVIKKVRVPLGVIAIIYESRPNVTADAASLCLKSSNAVILRGGSEALRTNTAIAQALTAGLVKSGLPAGAVQLVNTADREAVRALVQLDKYVNLVIPRGGEGLIRTVVELARVPVLKHYKGVCHVYVDESADLEMALRICENAKCQRPGVCNAMETLLVHEGAAARFLPGLGGLLGEKGVELRGDEAVRALIPWALPAEEQDWYAEYLDLILAVRIVPNVWAAIDHINTYGSQHTDAVVAEDEAVQRAFVEQVDSGVVCINASTRFNDGGEFGMGAEMGISTDKVHARGPVALEELTSYKYIVLGSGQVRN